MELQEILKQPDGFTPPEVTIKIEKVYEYKSGESEKGPWSFQDIQVTGGRLKLKGLSEFPKDKEGRTVTLKANSSKQHGLTGMKVAHEEYQGKTYDKLIITGSAQWLWPDGESSGPVGHQELKTEYEAPRRNGFDQSAFEAHLLECADLAAALAEQLHLTDDSARQACFATVCIDAQRHNVILSGGDARRTALLKGVTSACQLLNAEGQTPPMTPKALDEYVNQQFNLNGGLASLAADNIEDLLKKLSDKLDRLRAGNVAVDGGALDDPDKDLPF